VLPILTGTCGAKTFFWPITARSPPRVARGLALPITLGPDGESALEGEIQLGLKTIYDVIGKFQEQRWDQWIIREIIRRVGNGAEDSIRG